MIVGDQAGVATERTARNSFLRVLGEVWPYLFLAILMAVFSMGGTGFLSLRNFQNIGLASMLTMVLALGSTFVIISGGIDLSIAYVMGLSAEVGAVTMRAMYAAHYDEMVTVIVGVTTGVLFSLIPGLINGVMIAKLKVPPFIATLGMYGISEGAAYLLGGGMSVGGQPPIVGKVGNALLLYVTPSNQITFFNPPQGLSATQLRMTAGILPISIIVTIVLVVICHFILSRTRFGQHTYIIGGSREAAIRAGILVDAHLIKVYMLSSLSSGIAGMLYVFRFSVAAPNSGEPLLLAAIAAVIIGGASMFGGSGKITGTVVGALIIAVLQTGLVMMNVAPFWQYVAVGAIIIAAVLVDQARERVLRD